jgi:hypothetical protein
MFRQYWFLLKSLVKGICNEEADVKKRGRAKICMLEKDILRMPVFKKERETVSARSARFKTLRMVPRRLSRHLPPIPHFGAGVRPWNVIWEQSLNQEIPKALRNALQSPETQESAIS